MPGSAGAQVITEFSAGITAGAGLGAITAGPDGNLWFTEGIDRIGRITPDGVVTEFSAGISAGAQPGSIAAGPDGSLWFTEPGVNGIGRITAGGVVTEFSAGIAAGASLGDITAGPDGNLWFTEAGLGQIGRITTSGVVTEFSAGIAASVSLGGITAGSDGNVWFTAGRVCLEFCAGVHRIGRITPLGVVTLFNAGFLPKAITTGPDGNLWFTDGFASGGRVGRITPSGTVTEFGSGFGPSIPGITTGPDGNLWFTEYSGNAVGRMTPQGVVVNQFKVGLTPKAAPNDIAVGPDGNLWFTEAIGRIGRITACMSEAACSSSTMTLASSLNPSHVGQAVVFTASVMGNFPTGTVQFMDGTNNLGAPVTLSGGGVAQLMTSTLTKGTHAIGAIYSGDNNNAPNASPVLSQIVKKARRRTK